MNIVYNSFKATIMSGQINLSGDDINVALMSATYSPDADTDKYWSNILAYETTGTNYTTSGSTLANAYLSADTTNDRGVFDADDVTWASSTITARSAVLYKKGGTPSTSPLICYLDFGTSKSSSNGDFVIQWNANGILTLN